jgi:hypothetical protein
MSFAMTQQDRFNEALVEIAQEMMSIVQNLPEASGWQEAYCDARFDSMGAGLEKLRICRRDETLISVRTSTKMTLLLRELWQLRDTCLTNSWYGLKVFVTPLGDCRTEFDFDPECAADGRFFDE